MIATIPAGDHHLALIVTIDQSYQIAEDQAVFVAQAGAGEEDCSKRGVGNVDCKPGRHQKGLARLNGYSRFDTGS